MADAARHSDNPNPFTDISCVLCVYSPLNPSAKGAGFGRRRIPVRPCAGPGFRHFRGPVPPHDKRERPPIWAVVPFCAAGVCAAEGAFLYTSLSGGSHRYSSAGSVTVNVEPFPGRENTVTLPPHSVTTRRTMERPRPLPRSSGYGAAR